MMDAFHDPSAEEIVMMLPSQFGKSEIVLNVLGYLIHLDPCPIMMIQPTVVMAEAFSKDRVAPMIRDTPALKGLIADVRTRDSGNTILHKKFPGGHFTLAGANSAASLASRPIRILLGDEIDRFPVSAGTEGDPILIAKKRTTRFWNAKTILVSSPTIKGFSRSEKEWLKSDQRLRYVPCPHCGEFQPLWFSKEYTLGTKDDQKLAGYLKWDKAEDGTPTNVRYICGLCKGEIAESEKAWMLGLGQWYATKPFRGIIGFHLNALYDTDQAWGDIVQEFLDAKADPEELKVFLNTRLAQCWEERGEVVDEDSLYARREKYRAEVPKKVLVLTAGVDVQDDRLEMEVVGWGAGEESWGITYRILFGDPAEDEVWERLDDILTKKFKHESGDSLRILVTCIDSGGHHTKRVYSFCKTRQVRGVFAIKGEEGSGHPTVSSPSPRRTGKDRRPVKLFRVGVDSIKATLYSRLKKTAGRGACHFRRCKEYSKRYFKGLTSEKRVPRKTKRGILKWFWILIYPYNEPLDCRTYATAALDILNPDWEALERRAKERRGETEEQVEEPPKEVRRPRPKRPRKGWLYSWRR